METVWADNTTQDRLEDMARQHRWTVVESTSTRTVLTRWQGTLTIDFTTVSKDGKTFTQIKKVSFETDPDTFDRFNLAKNLILRMS